MANYVPKLDEAQALREEARLDGLATLANGEPAWQQAKLLPGMTATVFAMRIKRRWSADRAARQPVADRAPVVDRFGHIRDEKYREFCREQAAKNKLLGIE